MDRTCTSQTIPQNIKNAELILEISFLFRIIPTVNYLAKTTMCMWIQRPNQSQLRSGFLTLTREAAPQLECPSFSCLFFLNVKKCSFIIGRIINHTTCQSTIGCDMNLRVQICVKQLIGNDHFG